MINPTVFGNFILLERISVGGMAEVFRAKMLNTPETETLFAIKRILPNLADNEEFVEMFINEAKVAISLLHPNVCQIHELGHLGHQHYIAMEYIAGRDIQAIQSYYRRQRKIMSVSQACFIIAQAAQGLDYAHRAVGADGQPLGIVHRDVSPQNLIVTFDGVVKLIDFGVAKASEKLVSNSNSGVVKGKFSYMSPEQACNGEIDHRSDIFALGVVFWEMLTGRRLFQSESEFAILDKIQNDPIEKPSKFNHMVPEVVDRICMKALEKDPARRYNWAGEMVMDLFDFINNKCKVPFTQWHLQKWMTENFETEYKAELSRLAIFRTINTEADIKRYEEDNAVRLAAEEIEAEIRRAEEEEKKKSEEALKVGSSMFERVSEEDPSDGPGSISMARRKPGEISKSIPGVKSISLPEDSAVDSGNRLSISRTDLQAESDDDVELEPEGVAPTVSDPALLQIKRAERTASVGRWLMGAIIAVCSLCICSPVLVLTGLFSVPDEAPDLPTSAELTLTVRPQTDKVDVAIYRYPLDSQQDPLYRASESETTFKELKAGTYAIAVNASGYEKEWYTLTVENGRQDATIELKRELAHLAEVTVNVTPEDASLYVNKHLHSTEGQVRTVKVLEGTSYEIRVFKAGYEPQVFNGQAEKNMSPLTVELEPSAPVQIKVYSEPSHASVYTFDALKNKSVKRGETPFVLEDVDTSVPLNLEIHKGHRVVWTHTVDFTKLDSNDIRVFADMAPK